MSRLDFDLISEFARGLTCTEGSGCEIGELLQGLAISCVGLYGSRIRIIDGS